jgi:hypothetical protein
MWGKGGSKLLKAKTQALDYQVLASFSCDSGGV